MLSNEKWFGASAGFYNGVATQSLRITNNGYLNMSTNGFANTPTLTTKGTLSFWIKVLDNADRNYIFMNYSANNNNGLMYIQVGSASDGLLTIPQYGRVPYLNGIIQRDFSNWYHFVVSFDSTSSTASERLMKIYQNGTQVTTGTFNAINQNDVFPFTAQGSANGGFTIGRHATVGYYTECILAEINLIDGQSLDASYFGEFKNGMWIPKEYTGSYGNNGCRFTFASSHFNTSGSSVSDPNGSSVDLFNNGISDASGNGNHLNLNSVETHDILLDSPENNFAILNKADARYGSFSEGNLRDTYATTGELRRSTHASKTGKWYVEVNCIGSGTYNLGIYPTEGYDKDNDPNYGVHYRGSTGQKVVSNVVSSYGATYGVNDIIGIAVDMDNNTVTFYKNNVSQGSISYTIDTDHAFHNYSASGSSAFFNFGADSSFGGNETAQGNTDANGQGDFYYSPPSGYLALCSSNLPDTTLSPNQSEQADDHFNTVLYTGNATDDKVVTTGFETDWVWGKNRGNTDYHRLYDSSRGALKHLSSNATDSESNGGDGGVKSFTSTGFTLDNSGYLNDNSGSYVSWNWKAGGTTPTKTYKVVVVSDSGNKYRFRNSADNATFAQSAVTINLQEQGTYVFDWSDSTAQGHPIRFSTTSDGTHGGGSEYTTGVVKDDSAYKTTITVAGSAPTLYYYCQNHSGMGGQVNTNTTHGSTNFDGDILSVVQTNETAGFSIVTYTGNGTSNADVTTGHGLGATPRMVIVKNRTDSGRWQIYHEDLSADSSYTKKNIILNLSNAESGYSSQIKAVSSTTFTVRDVDANSNMHVNKSGSNYVAYVFSEIEGYSKFGSYTGNGSSDGTFVYTGFRPAWILIKSSSHGEPWNLVDIKRDTFNVMGNYLQPNSSGAEATIAFVDSLSNGFKLRSSGSGFNGSGYVFIYMAFAEQPFKFSNAR